MRPNRLPLARLAAIYAVSLPVAWTLTPQGGPSDIVAAACAMSLTWMMGLPLWWLAINALFLPALTWGLTLEISPLWALGGLLTLVLVYGAIWKSRVPLFFSSVRTLDSLAELLPAGQHSFLDVGCGDGRVLARLAAARPDCRFEGIEQALVPWLLARLRCSIARTACRIRRGDLWSLDLAAYDMVYAYLSPAVMPGFWEKAQAEMRPGALLVSAFAIPGAVPHRFVDVGDALGTQLHVWRIGSRKASGKACAAVQRRPARRAPVQAVRQAA
jgi:SAM-dependent methyltransferase